MNLKKFSDLHQKILDFNKNRGWHPSSEDLAKSVVIESAELLEIFQWPGSRNKINNYDLEQLKKVRHEIADVLIYLFDLCDSLGIDFVQALEEKYLHNSQKYPVEKFQGQQNSDFYYQQKAKYRKNN